MKQFILPLLFFVLLNLSCETKTESNVQAEQGQEVELVFNASENYQNPYTDLDFWVEFTGPNNEKLIRPGFWDQGQTWKVRFASPTESSETDFHSPDQGPSVLIVQISV